MVPVQLQGGVAEVVVAVVAGAVAVAAVAAAGAVVVFVLLVLLVAVVVEVAAARVGVCPKVIFLFDFGTGAWGLLLADALVYGCASVSNGIAEGWASKAAMPGTSFSQEVWIYVAFHSVFHVPWFYSFTSHII